MLYFSLFTYSLYDTQKVIPHTSKIIILILYLYVYENFASAPNLQTVIYIILCGFKE